MKRDEAEYIALKYIASWAGLNVNINEDFYDYIPSTYLLRTAPNTHHEIAGNYYSHCATDAEREMIAKIFDKEYLRLLIKLKKIREKAGIITEIH